MHMRDRAHTLRGHLPVPEREHDPVLSRLRLGSPCSRCISALPLLRTHVAMTPPFSYTCPRRRRPAMPTDTMTTVHAPDRPLLRHELQEDRQNLLPPSPVAPFPLDAG